MKRLNRLLLAGFLSTSLTAHASPPGFVVSRDASTLGARTLYGAGLNDHADVVGVALANSFDPGVPFFWGAAGGVVALPIRSGFDGAVATDINNGGTVIGTMIPGGINHYPALWSYANGAWSESVRERPAGSLSGDGTAISNNGLFAGTVFSGTNQGFVGSTGSSGVTSLSSPGVDSRALGVSDNGAIVGFVKSSNVLQAAYWASGQSAATLLPHLGVNSLRGGQAVAINSGSMIVGVTDSDAGAHRIVVWSGPASKPIDLAAWKGGTESFQMAVNDSGQVVFTSFGYGYYWDASLAAPKKLGEMLGLSGTSFISEAADINESGQILATLMNAGVRHTVVLTPVAEPESAVMMLGGMLLVAWRSRKRSAGSSRPCGTLPCRL